MGLYNEKHTKCSQMRSDTCKGVKCMINKQYIIMKTHLIVLLFL